MQHRRFTRDLQWRYPSLKFASRRVSTLLRAQQDSPATANTFIHLFRPPPREQSKYERWSLVFFTRPSNTVPLHALTEESPVIKDAVAKVADPETFNPNSTAGEWFTRRIKNQRIKNRTVSSSKSWTWNMADK